MIKRNPAPSFVRRTGMLLALCFALASVGAVWSQSSGDNRSTNERLYFTFLSTITDMASGGVTGHQFELALDANKSASVTTQLNDSSSLDYRVSFTQPEANQVLLSMELVHDGRLIAEPTLVFGVDPENSASIRVGSESGLSYEISIEASRQRSETASEKNQILSE